MATRHKRMMTALAVAVSGLLAGMVIETTAAATADDETPTTDTSYSASPDPGTET